MKLLFSSGTARGGTNYRTLLLNNHSKVVLTLDPFIPLFRYFRDSLLRNVGFSGDMPSVLDDYYFSIEKSQVFRALQAANPDIEFGSTNWPTLKQAIARRMGLASMNAIPYLDMLPAATFREVFQNTVKLIWTANGSPRDVVWIGFNDNWAAEFFPLVAKLLPDAKFLLHLRDPRAVVHSSEYAEPDIAKRPTVSSFARGLRKYFALGSLFSRNRILQNRLLITYYEPFIEDPHREVKRVCDFLALDYEPSAVDTSLFRKANGDAWPSNWNNYKDSHRIWREEMPEEMAELTEFICEPEMGLHGYRSEIFCREKGLSDRAFEFAVQNERACVGWRTSFQEVERTIGSEYFRRMMLSGGGPYSIDEVRRCFLAPEIFSQLNPSASVC
jgi:hypothetical protein